MHSFRSKLYRFKILILTLFFLNFGHTTLQASEKYSYNQMRKNFNQQQFLPEGLRIISLRRSCVPKHLWYSDKQLTIACQFSEKRTDDLIFESKFLNPELGGDRFSVKLNENTLVTFHQSAEASDFYQSLVMLICKEEEAKYAYRSESSFLKLKDAIQNFTQSHTSSEALVPQSEIEVKKLLFDFHRNHNIYFDSRFYPKYLKDSNPSILEFSDRFLTISQKSFGHMMLFSLRNFADILKIISVNCFCESETLKQFELFFSSENDSLTTWISRQNIYLSDTLSKLTEKYFDQEDLLSLLKDENDFMFLLILRSNLGGVRPLASDTIFTSNFQQSRLRVFLLLQLFRSSQPDYQEFFEEITNEQNGPELQTHNLDFDYYGRFAQAGCSVSEFLKMELDMKKEKNDQIFRVYNSKVTELLNQWLLSTDFFSFLNGIESDHSQLTFISTLLDLEAGSEKILAPTAKQFL